MNISTHTATPTTRLKTMTTHFMKLSLAGLLLFLLLIMAQRVNAAPKIENWVTDSGLQVYYVHVPELPMLDARLTFAAGSAHDGDKPGLANMTTGMLDKGAAGLNADQIAEAFESVGAEFSAGSARDMAWIGLRTVTLADQMTPAIKTWQKIIAHPDFPDADFARLKKQELIGLEAEKQSPAAIASKAFYKNLYHDHPYAQPQNGTEASIKAMTIDDLKGYYRQFFVVKNAQLALVGSINRKQAETLANSVAKALMSNGKGAGEKAPEVPEVQPLQAAKTVRIPYPSKQAHIMIGQPGDKRGDKDYFSLYLGNHVLGGSGFTSRLMKEVRVKRGLAYSVYSYFIPMQENGPFMLGLQTKLSQTDEALKVVRDVLEKFQKEGPSEKDLKASKLNITGGFPLRTASNDDIMSYIAMIGFYGLPLDYLDTFTEKVNKISRDEVIDAFKRRVHPDKMLTIIVGGKAVDKKDADKKATDEKTTETKKDGKPSGEKQKASEKK